MRALVGSLAALLIACGRPAALPPSPPPAPQATTAAGASGSQTAPVLVPQLAPRVVDVALSPDGALMLLPGPHALHLVDTDSGEIRAILPGCAERATFAPDGARVAILGCGQARLWDLRTQRLTPIRPEPKDAPFVAPKEGLRFSADGAHLMLYDSVRIAVADGRSGMVSAEWELKYPKNAYPYINTIAFDPAGTRIATGHHDHLVRVWDRDGKAHEPFVGPGMTHTLAWSPDGASLVSGHLRGEVVVWDAATGVTRAQAKPCNSPVDSVAWSPDGQHIAAACRDTEVAVQRPDLTLVTRLSGDRAGFTDVAFDASGRRLLGLQNDRGPYLWDVDGWTTSHHDDFAVERYEQSNVGRGGAAWTPALGHLAQRVREGDAVVVRAMRDGGALIEMTPNVRTLVARRAGGSLVSAYDEMRNKWGLWDPTRDTFENDVAPFVDFIDGGRKALRSRWVGYKCCFIESVDTVTGAVTPLREHPEAKEWWVEPIAWSRRGTWLIGIGRFPEGHMLELWDGQTGALKLSYPLARKGDYLRRPSADSSPDERRIAAFVRVEYRADGSPCVVKPHDGCLALRLASLPDGRAIATIPFTIPDDENIDGPLFNADGSLLSAESEVYDGRTGAPYLSLVGHRATVPWSRDGERLFEERWGRVEVWDVRAKKVIATLEGADDILDASPDGALLLARHGASYVLWDTTTWRPTITLPTTPEDTPPTFSMDGRFLLWGGAVLTLYRLSDGQRLHRFLDWKGSAKLAWTPEGVFDGDDRLARFRVGGDLRTAKLAPATKYAARFAHPALLADFLAGKRVRPGDAPLDERSPSR